MKSHIIFLIGGSSGTGKSHLARQLSEYYKIPLTEVDDIRIALQQVADKKEYPALFTFIDNPNFYNEYSEYQFTERLLDVAKIVWKSLSVLISKHITCNEPVIFEGDSITPDLVNKFLAEDNADNIKIKAIFIHDDIENIRERQVKRGRDNKGDEKIKKNALFSYTYGNEIKRQAEAHGFLTISASPIETLFERTIKVLEN